MEKTLLEIYNWKFIEKPETALLKRINKILNKKPSELDAEDICILVRQELFLDIAIPKAIELIKSDHSVGDNYDYCLLYNLSNIQESLSSYKDSIVELISILEADFKSQKFELDDDKNDYLDSIERLKDKIS